MKQKHICKTLFCGLSISAFLIFSSGTLYAENTAPAEDTSVIVEDAAFDYHTYAQGLFQVAAYRTPDLVWDIKTCTTQEKVTDEIQLYHPLDINQQKFYFENFADGLWRISDLRTGQALTLSADGSTVLMAPMEHPADSAASLSQTWRLSETEEHAFYIQSMDEKYLTLNGLHNYCGKKLSLEEHTGSGNQKWKLDPTWLSSVDSGDTDLVNPYAEDGPYGHLYLTIKIGDGAEALTASMLAEHTVETENHEYVLDPEYLPAYVEELAAKYDTQDNSRRFITTAGNEITLTVGNFGYKLNKDETLALIRTYLQTDTTNAIKPVYVHKVTKLGHPNGINDIGDSYVEVDIGTQKVWLYHYGELLMESDCVTGTYHSTDTVQGAYAIFHKQSPATLTGPGYSSPVDFWMPFYNGYGLHNAGWRSSFGGDIYKTNGSHGCVNMPYDTAKLIYDTVQIGYPVIVYSSIPEDAAY